MGDGEIERCGKPTPIDGFTACTKRNGHGGACGHERADNTSEDRRCPKCGNDPEAWSRLLTELGVVRESRAALRMALAESERAHGDDGNAAMEIHVSEVLRRDEDRVDADVRGEIERLRDLGCSDGYCEISGKAAGMHTNGGCRCLWRLGEHPEQVIKLRKALRILHEERAALLAACEAMAAALRDGIVEMQSVEDVLHDYDAARPEEPFTRGRAMDASIERMRAALATYARARGEAARGTTTEGT